LSNEKKEEEQADKKTMHREKNRIMADNSKNVSAVRLTF